MVWGLKQGIMGYAQQTLSPSLSAMGPNRYLREKDFFTMLAVALGAHLMVVLVASLMPGEKVKDIPVRSLSFKIGGHDKIAAYGLKTGIGATTIARAPQPQAEAQTPALSEPRAWRATPVAKPAPKPVKAQKVVSVPREQRVVPQENQLTTLEPVEVEAPPKVQPPLPDTSSLTTYSPPAPAIAPEPQRFIRETGMAPPAGQVATNANMGQGIEQGAVGGEGNENVMTPSTAQTVRERYEQQISAWIQQHKIYPSAAAGAEGKVVMRMRIDRTGYVRYYALEQSSGNAALDAAAIDMIRRANPVPAVPADYPAGDLLEFLIPVNFRLQ